IFKRCGLEAVPVKADTGVMGGNISHEFMVLAPSGEDAVAQCRECGYAANSELAERLPAKRQEDEELKAVEEVDTPNMKTVDELTAFFKTSPSKFIKTLIYKFEDETIAVLVRGDIDVNELKLKKVLNSVNVEMADPETIQKVTGAPVGFSGPVGLKIKIIADMSIKGIVNGITGANKKDKHFINVNDPRDYLVEDFFDIGTVKSGDQCVKCDGVLEIRRGIEVGQVFKLGSKYSATLGATYLDRDGQKKETVMGCYGIGITRTVAAIIEQNHDDHGIIWSMSVAPYEVIVVPISSKDEKITSVANALYEQLVNERIDVVIDDRPDSPGVKFKDADLMGFPIKLIIGPKNLKEGKAEIKLRKDGTSIVVDLDQAVPKIKELIHSEKLYV
ncbi:proline--tRNA ligase, partial [Candidatus Auribacterota bacterium]